MTSISDQIINICEIKFNGFNTDCNKYIKVVSESFFNAGLFKGLNADGIIDFLSNATNGWTNLGKDHASAIIDAKANKFVIAGMKSSELNDDHGHLAVVVGLDGQASGTIIVPICFAGSLNPRARVSKKRVSETFSAIFARENKISYFSKSPDRSST